MEAAIFKVRKHFVRRVLVASIAVAAMTTATAVNAYGFGEDWKFASCTYKDSKKKTQTLPWKHAGVDIMASVGKNVAVNADLYFVTKHEYSDGWRWGLIARTKDNSATYLFLHMENVPAFKAGDSLRGKNIGTIANLSKKGVASHLHLGYRRAAFKDSVSWVGALPPAKCTSGTSGYPDYAEKFASPDRSVVNIR